ncbi:MAG: cation:proton antiporter [Alphaproteobacteria bacterium]
MEDVALTIVALTVLLGLASLLVPLSNRLRVPHAVLLAALGIALGLAAVATRDSAMVATPGGLLLAYQTFHFNAEALLFVFLPPLLFTAGLGIDIRRLFDEFAAVLMLAVVAVLVCTAVVGSALGLVGQQGWLVCFLLGAMVATTDPAAVVAVFRDLGAPRRLTILVQGESLFNDAAAIAIFGILLDVIASQQSASIWDGVWNFLHDFIGGVVLGYVMARGAFWLMRNLGGSLVAEITITIVLAYLAFTIGEQYLDVSGIVAVAVASLTVAAYGPVRLSPRHWKTLVEVWHHLEFWANSLIFMLAAMLAARLLSEADWDDLLFLAVLVISAIAARALVLYGMLPGLAALKLVQPVDRHYKAVILWGGLRGAVTLVLALSIGENEHLSAESRHFVAVLATGFVLFTLFVSATTLRPLLRLLGLDRLGPVELALRQRVMELTRVSVRTEMEAFARESNLDPRFVHALTAIETPRDGVSYDLTPAERLQVGLLTLATREKALYFDRVVERTASKRLVAILVAAADRLIDRVKTGGVGGYERGAQDLIGFSRGFRFAHWLQRRFGLSQALARQIADRFEILLINQLALRELDKINSRSIRVLLGDDTSAALGELLVARTEAVRDALSAIELQYPRYAEALRTQYVARAALRLEEADYEQKLSDALISPEVYADLQGDLMRRRQDIDRRTPLDLGLRLAEMVRRVPMFADLSADAMTAFGRMLRPRLAFPGERIIRKGDRGDAMFFITGGDVEVQTTGGPVRLSDGDFFGELALLTRERRNADVFAVGFCHLLTLDAADFGRLLDDHPTLRAAIEEAARRRLAPA